MTAEKVLKTKMASRFLFFCLGIGILLLLSAPFMHAIAPNGIIH